MPQYNDAAYKTLMQQFNAGGMSGRQMYTYTLRMPDGSTRQERSMYPPELMAMMGAQGSQMPQYEIVNSAADQGTTTSNQANPYTYQPPAQQQGGGDIDALMSDPDPAVGGMGGGGGVDDLLYSAMGYPSPGGATQTSGGGLNRPNSVTASASALTPEQLAQEQAKYSGGGTSWMVDPATGPGAEGNYVPTLNTSSGSSAGVLGPAPQPNLPPATGNRWSPYTGNAGQTSSGPSTGGGINYDEFDTPNIGGITLPDTPLLSPNFDPAFQEWFDNYSRTQADDLGRFYDQGGDWGQLDLSAIPQTEATQAGSNSALDFLLSGKGFGDDIMSLLRGRATDDIMRGAASDRSSARLTAQRHGLEGSGAGAALESGVNRRATDDRNRALNSLDVENAGRGLENLRMGAGMELGRSTSNAEMMNQNALQNAARLFSGMQQNVANTQQRNLSRAGAQSDFQGGMGSMFGGASIDRANTADQGNVSNRINRDLNQAQLDRQRDMFNVGTGEGRNSQALSAAMGLINGANPQGYYASGANAASGYNPNMIPANTLTNTGTQLLDMYNQFRNRNQTPQQ